jgi:chromosome segregation ATPase
LLTLGGDKDCPLCGAPPDAQRHVQGLKDIERATEAAKMEIGKIARQRVDLSETLSNLNAEGKQTELKLEELDLSLRAIELELNQLAPAADSAERRLSEILSVRDQIHRGLSLIEQRRTLLVRRDELAALKPARNSARITTAVGLKHSMRSPAAMRSSVATNGSATKYVTSDMAHSDNPNVIRSRS